MFCVVSKFARDKIQPLVREMDEKGRMPDHLIKDLFANGVTIISLCNCILLTRELFLVNV